MKRTLLLVLVLSGWTAAAPAADWSFWRGPEQNGVSEERDLPDSFSLKGKNLIWHAPYGGISTPIVLNGRVYVITRTAGEGAEGAHQQEQVICFDAETGKVLWRYQFNVFQTDIVASRLGWTNLVADPETGNIYAHGTQGFLICFNRDGKPLWQRSLTEEYGRVSGYGGRLSSPIIDGDLVILSMVNSSWGEQAIGCTRFVAFNKRTGAVVWWGTTNHRVHDTYSSVPVVANIAGQRLLIGGGGDGGVHAFKVATGEKVWSYIFGEGAVNCAPVVQGNRVWIAHGEENHGTGTEGRVICLDAGTVTNGEPKLVWKVDGIRARYASPILHQGRLYIPDEIGTLYCLDANTGKELWNFQYGRNSHGSPVWADGKIYVGEVDARFHILKPEDDSCTELYSQYFRSQGGGPVEVRGNPAVANGKVYFMTSAGIYCIGKKGAGSKGPEGKGEETRHHPAETHTAQAGKPAHIQVVPADVELVPGEKVGFLARAFDDQGRPLGEVKVDWSLTGMSPPVFPIGFPPQPKPKEAPQPPPALRGELSAQSGTTTQLTVAKAPPGQFGRVLARVGNLTGEARVRVAPGVPYAIDFSKVPVGRTPAGWVNCQGKFATAKLKDGSVVLSKRNDNPNALIAQAITYIGMPDLTGYTIEADVQGTQVGGNLPEMGVIANRYTLMLAGNQQQLRLVSWEALPRIDNTITWHWKPNIWYRMRLRVDVKGDHAIARGKVWPRNEKEPEKWTIQVEDPCPNLVGSPALYGYSVGVLDVSRPGTEIFYDRVRITPNK